MQLVALAFEREHFQVTHAPHASKQPPIPKLPKPRMGMGMGMGMGMSMGMAATGAGGF